MNKIKRFNIYNKRQILYTLLDKDSSHSITYTSLYHIYFYFWHMTFHTLHEYKYIQDNWYRTNTITSIVFFSKHDSVKKKKLQKQTSKQTKQNKAKKNKK